MMIPYGRQDIQPEDIEAVTRALRGDFLTQGPMVAEFERVFADFVGASYAIAMNNATTALHLGVLALGVKPGQKVLCTPNTFVASSNCVLYCGGEVEFVDLDPINHCLSIEAVRAKLASAPRGTYAGVIAVDFAGYPLNFEALSEITKSHGAWLIQDACHAPGAEFKTRSGWSKAGSGEFADLATFSFHPVKHIATGEGGMITTRSKTLFETISKLRTHGITKNPADYEFANDGGWYHEMQSLGFNGRMPDILCALGVSQMKRIGANLDRRRQLAARYRDGLAGLPIEVPKDSPNIKHAYHLFVIQTPQRRELYDFLKSRQIYCQVHYIPIYKQPYYVSRYGTQKLPQAESYYEKALSIPMYHALTDAEQDQVIGAIREFFKK